MRASGSEGAPMPAGCLDRTAAIELGQPDDSECLLPSLEVSVREIDEMSNALRMNRRGL